jgi:hypothetical protein
LYLVSHICRSIVMAKLGEVGSCLAPRMFQDGVTPKVRKVREPASLRYSLSIVVAMA